MTSIGRGNAAGMSGIQASGAKGDAQLNEREQQDQAHIEQSALNNEVALRPKKSKNSLLEGIKGLILTRVQTAWVANSLGLVDHAVFILKKAYSEVRGDLKTFLSSLNGQNPTPEQQEFIDVLRALQELVLSRMKLTLGSHGGPNLTIEEIEAMMITDEDMNPQGMDPKAAEILKSFNHNKSPEALKKNAFSAVDKIAKKLPEILLSVAETLQTLMANPDAGAGSAQMFVNGALSKLELAKGLLRILSGTENAFKAMAVQSLDLTGFQEQIDELSIQADQVYRDLETRGFIRGRAKGLSNMPTVEELEMMAKNPDAFKQKMEALNPQNLDKNRKPITNISTVKPKMEVSGLSGLGKVGNPGLIGLNAQG